MLNNLAVVRALLLAGADPHLGHMSQVGVQGYARDRTWATWSHAQGMSEDSQGQRNSWPLVNPCAGFGSR